MDEMDELTEQEEHDLRIAKLLKEGLSKGSRERLEALLKQKGWPSSDSAVTEEPPQE